MLEDKIYTLEEMRSLGIDTLKYKLMDEAGEVIGTLMLKAESRRQGPRLFLTLKMVAISSRPSSFGSWVKACKTSLPGQL